MPFEVMGLKIPVSVQRGQSHKDEAARVSCSVGVSWSMVEEKWAHRQQRENPYDVGVYLGSGRPLRKEEGSAATIRRKIGMRWGKRVYRLGTNRT
jgi:hypothetical protein